MDNELLFHWFAMYMADEKLKDKIALTDPLVLEWIKNVDDIIKDYIQKKKLTIKYTKKTDSVCIYKWKKLILALDPDKFLINNLK